MSVPRAVRVVTRSVNTREPTVIEHALAHYRERYGDIGWRENELYDGIEEALADAARSMPVYVCTSKPEVFARRIVTLFGLSPYVRRVYGADLDGTLDDKVKLFAHAARSEGFDTEGAILIGVVMLGSLTQLRRSRG